MVRLILDVAAPDGHGEVTIRTVDPELTLWKQSGLPIRPGMPINFHVSLPSEIADILHEQGRA